MARAKESLGNNNDNMSELCESRTGAGARSDLRNTPEVTSRKPTTEMPTLKLTHLGSKTFTRADEFCDNYYPHLSML